LVILITRPGEPGQRLTAQLAAAGHAALWWPAFDLLPPADPQRVKSSADRLAQYDLVVFVSPMAVRAFAAVLHGAQWPGAARIAAVGGATLRATREELNLGAHVHVIGPDGPDAADGGTEALWPLLERLPAQPRRVLIVRAQTGRAWLAQRLVAAGAAVEELETYRRVAHEPAAGDWAALRSAVGANTAAGEMAAAVVKGAPIRRMAVLFSSTEAVGVVTQALQGEHFGAAEPGAIALCVHDRIAEAARAAGWQDVRRCDPATGAVLAALSAPGPAAAGPAPSRAAAG
jgi:uroporphyrinogen-III synthase